MRTSVPAALAALAIGLPALVVEAVPAQAPCAIFVETNPREARPGDQVGLRAGCTDNLAQAKVTGDPFGTVTVQPRYGFPTPTPRVPAATVVGDYKLIPTCPGGKTASTVINVGGLVTPSQG